MAPALASRAVAIRNHILPFRFFAPDSLISTLIPESNNNGRSSQSPQVNTVAPSGRVANMVGRFSSACYLRKAVSSNVHASAEGDPRPTTGKGNRAMEDRPLSSRGLARGYTGVSSKVRARGQTLPKRSQYCQPRPDQDCVWLQHGERQGEHGDAGLYGAKDSKFMHADHGSRQSGTILG
jgi:hypothetical protein